MKIQPNVLYDLVTRTKAHIADIRGNDDTAATRETRETPETRDACETHETRETRDACESPGIPNISNIVGNADEWQVFRDRFASEEDCIGFLYEAKWPVGFECPRCGHGAAYVISSRRLPLYQCRSCRHQTSLTAGTIMEDSRTPLRKWLLAIYLFSCTERGINAVKLHSLINVTYKTAWSMLYLIRHAISKTDEIQPLHGLVRGAMGLCSSLRYRSGLNLHPQEKPVIIGASLNEEAQPVHVKIKLISLEYVNDTYLQKSAIRAFTEEHVEAGTENISFHQRFELSRIRPVKELFDQVMLRLTNTFRGLKYGHLQGYLDEACYRFNLKQQDEPVLNHLSRLCMTIARR
jgi:transposase-like protein